MTQLTWAAPSTAHSAPHGEFQYYPILKTLPGEMQALQHASPEAWERMTPLIEVATLLGDDDDIPAQSPLARLGSTLAGAIGLSRLCFLDFHSSVGIRLIRQLLDQCSAYGLTLVPVISYQTLDRVHVLRDKVGFTRGVCLRVPIRDRLRRTGQSLSEQLDRLLAATVNSPGHADLVLDLGFIAQEPGFGPEHIARTVAEVEQLNDWRSVALAGTVIPQTLADVIEQDNVGALDRHDWEYWQRTRRLSLPRQLSFADYAVQSPERPKGGRGAMANIRYTASREVVIARGHKVSAGDAQYGELARKIQQHSAFRGAAFSWGDAEIATYANGAPAPTGGEAWRAFGTSHHIELVTRSLAEIESAA